MIVYLITNKVNGKRYIGQTVNSPSVRWSQHIHQATKKTNKSALGAAIRLYGKENFLIKVISKCDSIQQMNHREIYYIKLFKTLSPNGYNLDSGGKNKKMHEETKKKLSVIRLGKKLGPHSLEHKKNLSKSHKGKKYPNRVISKKTRQKISFANFGSNNGMFGKKHTDETKNAIRIANTGNKYWVGKKHNNTSKEKISKAKDHLKIKIICNETGQIFESINQASRFLKIFSSQIKGVLTGQYKQAKGFTFSYLQKRDV